MQRVEDDVRRVFMGMTIDQGETESRGVLSTGLHREHPLDVPAHRHQIPFAFDAFESSQQTLPITHHRFDDPGHRFRRLLSKPVGCELSIKRPREFRIVRCNAVPRHSEPGLPSVMKDSPHDSPGWCRRWIGVLERRCNRRGIVRASGEGRSNSRRTCGPDIRAGSFRSISR